MIIAKQMIKTNQILSVGMESFYWKNSRKTNKSVVITERYSKFAIQSENQQSQHHLPCLKKVKEVLRTRLSGNKIT